MRPCGKSRLNAARASPRRRSPRAAAQGAHAVLLVYLGLRGGCPAPREPRAPLPTRQTAVTTAAPGTGLALRRPAGRGGPPQAGCALRGRAPRGATAAPRSSGQPRRACPRRSLRGEKPPRQPAAGFRGGFLSERPGAGGLSASLGTRSLAALAPGGGVLKKCCGKLALPDYFLRPGFYSCAKAIP